MSLLLIIFLLLFSQGNGNLLINSIQEIEPARTTASFKAFGLAFSGDPDFSYLSSELAEHEIHLQIIDCVKERTLPKQLKANYCSRNVSPYLLAQVLSHLNTYVHCIANQVPYALILEKNAFLYGNATGLTPLVEEAFKVCPGWDVLFTDVHYHIPKDGSLAFPQITQKGKVLPTHKKLSQNLLKVNYRYGTEAFFISQKGMEKILRFYTTHWLDLPLDQALFRIPGLKILSANRDIITNAHRCPKYDRWQKERIACTSRQIKELATKEEYTIGEDLIPPSSLLIPVNWELIYSHVKHKYHFLGERCSWITELNQALPHIAQKLSASSSELVPISRRHSMEKCSDLSGKSDLQTASQKETVLISTRGKILSGVEEVAKALQANTLLKVKVVEAPDSNFTFCPLNHEFHLSEEQKDFIAQEYVQLFPDHYIVCLFPAAEGLDTLTEEILEQQGCILYKKEIEITPSGSLEFIKLIYPDEGWVGNLDNQYELGRVKAKRCFPPSLLAQSPLRIYLYYCPSLEKVKETKSKIRHLYQCGNDSVHIQDTKWQAELIGATVFNDQSLHFLNHRRLRKVPNFDWFFSCFQLNCVKKHISTHNCCIDSSAVLAAYGLRDCADLDILHDPSVSLGSVEGIQSHNSYLKFYSLSLEEMLWNPTQHFYFNGVKFLALDRVKEMKKKRKTAKDLKDVKLIESLDL